MAPRQCGKDECTRRLTKGDKATDLDGKVICRKCWQRDAKLAKEKYELLERQVVLDKKIRAVDAVVKVETKKRHKLEATVVDRMIKWGGYQLEGLDAKLVPNGVVAYRMEEAESAKQKSDRVALDLGNKLREERRTAKLKARQQRSELADKTEEVFQATKL